MLTVPLSRSFTRAWTRLKPSGRPVRLLDDAGRQAILGRYAGREIPWLSYGIVADFCDSADHLPQVCRLDGDLKNVQRPWAVKAVVARARPGARLVEIGAGVPTVAGLLAELGYAVTVVDPYEGAGNGPTEYRRYVRMFPHVTIVRAPFDADTSDLLPASLDCVYSVSVLEHLSDDGLDALFAGIAKFLRPGGLSIHAVDHVTEGPGADWHAGRLKAVIGHQLRLAQSGADIDRRRVDAEYDRLMASLGSDLETFYLSPQGHQLWRSGRPYSEFSFRKVVSVQSCAARPAPDSLALDRTP